MQSTYKQAIYEANKKIDEAEHEIELLLEEKAKNSEIIKNQEKMIRQLQGQPKASIPEQKNRPDVVKSSFWMRILARKGKTQENECQKDNSLEDLIKLICDENLDDSQVEEIELGWRAGLNVRDIKRYASPENNAESMRKRREFLCELRDLPYSVSKLKEWHDVNDEQSEEEDNLI